LTKRFRYKSKSASGRLQRKKKGEEEPPHVSPELLIDIFLLISSRQILSRRIFILQIKSFKLQEIIVSEVLFQLKRVPRRLIFKGRVKVKVKLIIEQTKWTRRRVDL
jgi:hypothetical protein